MIILSGMRNKYRMRNPMNQMTVNLHDINSYPLLVRVKRFQFLSSSASNLEVTSSSIIASIPDFTYSKQSSSLKSSGLSSLFSYKKRAQEEEEA
jgi:hypothetical protein